MKQKFDIGIIGAGLSGLTLGNSLLSKKIKNFILIEKNTHLKNDKTYSFWSGPGLFDIKKSFSVKPKKEWSQIEIKVKNKSYKIDLGSYRYACYSSESILDELYKKITKEGIKVERGQSINHVKKNQDGWEIKLKNKKILLKNVIDSRPNKIFDDKYPSLKQVFVGSEIISNQNIFDENVVTLMDFSESNKNVIFTYILPFSKNKALIETTFFSSEINFKQVEKIHNLTLKKFDIKEITRTEQAVLPMSPYIDRKMEEQYFRIGNFGGASRPASGYAFTRIALWADQIKTKKEFCYDMIHHKENYLTNWLDKIFLSVLRSNPQKAPEIFKVFFTKVPISSVIRFLSDQSRLVDYFVIILKLPKLVMLRGLINLYVK
ncbi:carotene-cycl, lycopene cyclase family protein [Candidatus Methylopumilus planktonicus]|uniref:lycopene cyclase family protein n=1 Tax=Candidatus Methylopumilus planktonicus TaxID=1581557 RepID=UPI003BEEB1F1